MDRRIAGCGGVAPSKRPSDPTLPLGLALEDRVGVVEIGIPFAAVVGANADSLAVACDQVVKELEADPALG